MRSAPRPAERRARRAALVGLVLLAGAPAAANEPVVVPVMVDNAKLIRLPEKTQTVIVGNPMIADVSLQKNGVLILTGKAFGMTNLIALDASGTMIAESMIRVEGQQAATTVTVQRGPEQRESYSCTPNCQPTAQLGDSSKWFTDISGQADRRRTLATGSGGEMGGAAGMGGGVGGPGARR